MDYALMAIAGVLCIVAVTVLAPRAGVAGPLVLVVVGVLASFVPGIPAIEIEPEVILAGVLPPLLYATAVSMPTMEFRRDFASIGGLSVVLVVVSSVALGLLFWWLIPGIPLALGIALGAVVSPTDAVATQIVKGLGVSPRIVAVLEGESLLNDASALVLLRSAVAALAVSVSLLGVAWDFVVSVVIAVAIGLVVGLVNLRVRHAVRQEAASTAVSFVAPFIAYIPAEYFDASGLVAAVTAGIVTGIGAIKYLRPQDRMAERANWRTVQLLLEGGVFLVVGFELIGTVDDVRASDDSAWTALWIGALAALAIVLLRAVYVTFLVANVRRRARRAEDLRERLPALAERIRTSDAPDERIQQAKRRVRRKVADIDYVAAVPLGWREGTVLVWAGMRGAVTVAAAQTLPLDVDQRPLLLLIAFVVAIGTLFVQGGSLGLVVRWLGIGGAETSDDDERVRLMQLLRDAAQTVIDASPVRRADGRRYDPRAVERVREMVSRKQDPVTGEVTSGPSDEGPARVSDGPSATGSRELLVAPAAGTGPDARSVTGPQADDVRKQYRELRLRTIEAQRAALLEARSLGTFSSAALQGALDMLDADQISAELRGGPLSDGEQSR
ncbi:sodium:proton antiporter [Cellulomonas sp. PhB143]|uniref:cation:proton antiporter n=1 Tax=Cellulomonas sp. PhB143 TaxID=2485186 RepID=UPI000F46B537|nr:cation:proton antiporter [Cellulomonas sp. PhB143]ROS75328.1 sodium/proton antiporter (CPA1 family) [Cellulomonas sp. PhB143]